MDSSITFCSLPELVLIKILAYLPPLDLVDVRDVSPGIKRLVECSVWGNKKILARRRRRFADELAFIGRSLAKAIPYGKSDHVANLLRSPEIDLADDRCLICVNGRRIPPLVSAVYTDKRKVVSMLLARRDVDVNQRELPGERFLAYGYSALHVAVSLDNLKILGRLLAQPGIDVNQADSRGWTALVLAVHCKNVGAARMLLRHPDIHLPDRGVEAAAQLAFGRSVKLAAIVELIQEHPRHQSCRNVF